MRPQIAIGLLVCGLFLAGGLELAERHLMDLRFRLLDRAAEAEVVVVAIDPRSLSVLDVWPWPRGYHATVLETLHDAGASRVAFDLDFSSRSIAEEDGELARSLERVGGGTILPYFSQHAEGPGHATVVTTRPLPELESHAELASINISPDGDGVVRRYGVRDDALDEGGLTLAAALADQAGAGPDEFYVDFAIDPRSITRISYIDVLTGTFDARAVEGRPVIVGATAVELGDQVATPIHATIPGPLLQALAYESMVSGRMITRPHPAAACALALGLLLTVGLAFGKTSWRRGGALLAASVVALLALALVAQRAAPLSIDLSPALGGLALAYAWSLAIRIDRQALHLLFESARARRLESRMRHVVRFSSEAIVTVDDEGTVETFNPAAERLFGRRQADAVGEDIRTLLPDGLPEPDPELRPIEGEGRRVDGSPFDLEMSITAFPSEGRRLRVAFMRDVSDRKAHERILEHQATHDGLTDLPNRVMLQRIGERVLAEAERSGSSAAFVVLDLDRFKDINDTLGHQLGDALLGLIARRLRGGLSSNESIARLGGDEFAVVLPDIGREAARLRALRIIGELAEPFRLDGMSLQIDANAGIALYPTHGADVATLLQRGDVAMYSGKKLRRRVSFYDPEEDFNSVRHLTLRGELRHAIEDGQFELNYQPKIHLRRGRMVGVEALLRWNHPEHGRVPPDEFIPLAEHTGLIGDITDWVLDAAAAQCSAWSAEGLSLGVAVNCSARNLLEEDFPKRVESTINRHGVPPSRLTLEITETAIIDDPRRALEVVTMLTELGVGISIDDFGTGYSSLDYLRRLPARELKIDKAFVCDMEEDGGSAAIVRSTIDLAHNLGLQVIAEGIESAEVRDRLTDLGCDMGQGYFFSAPLAAKDLEAWIKSSEWSPSSEQVETVETIFA